MTARADGRLLRVLEEARSRGFLGPGPVAVHVAHARRLGPALDGEARGVDLGSGGGVPVLVFAVDHADMTWVLVESTARRAAWLREAVPALGLQDRVEIRQERAEETGRCPLRGSFSVVTARSFGPPAVTAECGAPLLDIGGTLWVSEPPEPDPDRWPAAGLAMLGLEDRGERVQSWAGFSQAEACPDRYPRRVGIPAKRPLF